ncbi:uncharacterized protein LOC126650314 isoform X1 [Myiozetetes cayanensis]|uniref:uncharacterized protein LOC126650314 isoform X1 n=1 Tax=Myiozetetes cayanensis TaxID=478635 RepID=UPI00215ED70D|nr:uncharacterized protein LOC126650314 isoform X1 [Myiozetetes cayanensis]XP_050190865.1 uncharacterized protein LOC126650314 isoform X1 [Myiozetetes cayanensis]XP_050190866.1 uncharacterized protein LOC126650314 isoform X1 [Myiozetetes cayanensis]XP_050190867.1 uncharacterized protein LOC126650314 isoform X1 [Myiozetetes cayanensis]
MIHAVSEPPSAPARPTAAPDAAAQLPAAPAPSLSGSCARGWRGGSLPLWCGAAPLSPQHRGRLVGRGLGSPASAAPQKPARQERLRLAGPQLRGRTAEIARGGGGIAGTRPRWGWLHHSRGATRHGRCGRGPLSVRPSVRPSVLPSPPAAAGDGRRTALPLRIGSLGRAGLHRAGFQRWTGIPDQRFFKQLWDLDSFSHVLPDEGVMAISWNMFMDDEKNRITTTITLKMTF